MLSLDVWRRTVTVMKAPWVEINLYGDSDARHMFETFNGPHPRFPFIRYKVYGVALLRLPATLQDYLTAHKGVRKSRKQSQNAGYTFHSLKAMDYFEDLLAINKSSQMRQGEQIYKNYTDPDLVREDCERVPHIHGILRKDGTLAAYHQTLLLGDMFYGYRALGHAEDQKKGVMFLLWSEIIRVFIELRDKSGYPVWSGYDTFWGASQGLLNFKLKLGYVPHNVKWVWKDRPSDSNFWSIP